MRYNKLVRDKIPEIIGINGKIPYVEILEDNQYYRDKLLEKLQEEIKEFKSSGKSEEIADILEVIDAIIKDYNFDKELIEQEKEEKRESRGGFDSRILLEEVRNNEE